MQSLPTIGNRRPAQKTQLYFSSFSNSPIFLHSNQALKNEPVQRDIVAVQQAARLCRTSYAPALALFAEIDLAGLS